MEKGKVVQLDIKEIEDIIKIKTPSYYDIRDDTFIIIDEITLSVGKRPVVIVIASGISPFRVVTIYPCREINNEVKKKVESGKWIQIGKEKA